MFKKLQADLDWFEEVADSAVQHKALYIKAVLCDETSMNRAFWTRSFKC
jgi:hypothetical protein